MIDLNALRTQVEQLPNLTDRQREVIWEISGAYATKQNVVPNLQNIVALVLSYPEGYSAMNHADVERPVAHPRKYQVRYL